jgi:probable F420-dependent oxidoreductase
MKKIQFGVGIPTGTDGLMSPIPFAKARDNIRISQAAEKFGFDSVWGNDHVSTQHYVRDKFKSPPNYYAPLITLAAIAENTTTLKVATALLVVPFRHPAIIAKELATLDQLTGGRILIGVGIGAYREEFEAMSGEQAQKVNRGRLIDESLTIIQKIFQEDVVTYKGEYFDIHKLQSYPKPVQTPFPFYIGGNSPQGRERTARFGTGWLPAALTAGEIKTAVDEIQFHCAKLGRKSAGIDIAPQMVVSVGRTREEAEKKYKQSQLYHHLESLKKSTLKNQDTSAFAERNLIGTPADILEQIGRFMAAGVTTFSALLFAVNTVEEKIEAMQYFAEEVIRGMAK